MGSERLAKLMGLCFSFSLPTSQEAVDISSIFLIHHIY